MTSNHTLSLGFMDREPRSAARTLETIEPADAAEFLDHAPARITATVVARMRPWSAARCIEFMDGSAASALLMAMPHVDAVSVLRLVNSEVRDNLLKLTTDRFARRFRRAVAYRRDTVGAWMDVAVPSFEMTASVKDTLQTLRRHRQVHSHLFLTDSNRQYFGVVSVSELLCHDESASLSELADRSVEPISNQAPLVSYSSHPHWDRLNVLPVVGRKRNLLGGLSRSELRKGVSEPTARARILDHNSMILQVASAFVAVAAECANLALAARQEHGELQTED